MAERRLVRWQMGRMGRMCRALTDARSRPVAPYNRTPNTEHQIPTTAH